MKPSIAAKISPVLEKIRPHLNNIREKVLDLSKTPQGQAKLGAGAVVFIVLLIMVFAGGDSEPPVVMVNTKPQVEKKTLPPSPPSAASSQLILQIFSSGSEGKVSASPAPAEQIEQALSIAFVLTRCHTISRDDYANFYRALLLYAERSGAAKSAAEASAMLKNISQASNASYALVYSRISCTSPHLMPLANDIASWTKTVMTQHQ